MVDTFSLEADIAAIPPSCGMYEFQNAHPALIRMAALVLLKNSFNAGFK